MKGGSANGSEAERTSGPGAGALEPAAMEFQPRLEGCCFSVMTVLGNAGKPRGRAGKSFCRQEKRLLMEATKVA